jgi:uncharacterized SAM-binding protein YcdF (DUF218 family)
MNRQWRRGNQRGGILASLVSLLLIIVLCAAVYLARHPIMRFAAESWVVDEPAGHADAIIVLGDDNFYADRATHAAQLFRQGVAPIVVASGKKLRPNAGISELMEHDLLERGVPKEKILPFAHDSSSTEEEALALKSLAVEKNWKSAVIVTSNYHTRRVRYIFQRIFPRTIMVSVASAPDGEFDPGRWWEKRQSQKLFGHEMLGMLEAMWHARS